MLPRPCRVRAVIERPTAPPWIVAEVPFTAPTDWWVGVLLSWRWVDRDAGLWSGIVRYSHDGLSYEHAVSGELIRVQGADDLCSTRLPKPGPSTGASAGGGNAPGADPAAGHQLGP